MVRPYAHATLIGPVLPAPGSSLHLRPSHCMASRIFTMQMLFQVRLGVPMDGVLLTLTLLRAPSTFLFVSEIMPRAGAPSCHLERHGWLAG
jgi:hypothetical protein